MRYATQCSGIEAPSVAWHPLNWTPVFFSENAAFPSAVLAHHYPAVPNLGDMTRFRDWPDAALDLLCAGTPCQSFSVAGLRKGLDDPRGNLMLTYLATAARFRPRWLVWENVPGVLSIDGGRAFGTFLGGLGQLGYGFAHRVLDAQYFGVPQRRRRVFVVGCLGDWRAAAAVLFERHSLSGHPAPSREAGKGFAAATAPSLTGSGRGVERCGESRGQDPVIALLEPGSRTGKSTDDVRAGIGISEPGDPMFTLQAGKQHGIIAPDTARCIATREGTSQDWETTTMVAHSLRADGFDASEDGTGRGTPLVPIAVNLRGREGGAMPELDDLASLRAASGGSSRSYVADTVRSHPRPGSNSLGAIAFGAQNSARQGASASASASVTPTLDKSKVPGIGFGMQVRRLTPRECERLQGFEPDYTLIPWGARKKIEAAELLYIRLTRPDLSMEEARRLAADGPRYKALGNSMAVPVVRWIGERIAQVDHLMSPKAITP